MIKFAAICPHPPIIIPTIGSSFDLKKVSKTIKAMEKLAKIFEKTQPETVIIISPHGPLSYDEMTINISPALSGNFQKFGDYETELKFENDLELVNILQKKTKEQKIPVRLLDEPRLDHGCLVPLYYFTKNYSPKNNKPLKIIPLTYSLLDVKNHFEFGKVIYNICNSEKEKKFGIVASGDLSHRLTFDAPAGFNPKGAEFDKQLIESLNNNDTEGTLKIDANLIKKAGECGYLSFVILLGAMAQLNFENVKFKSLSYEGPFGVGYLVGYFNI